ncbi:MAG TPA: hypothetical protein VHR66_27895, partial [Gemmataceae bacterium]|nr:hypothetical protein [Gemmataceae bacterium]
MSIPVTCPECQSHFHVGDEFAGQPGRCPECAAVIEVPNPADAASDPVDRVDPHPYWTPRGVEAFEELPRKTREPRPEERRDPIRQDLRDRLEPGPRFDAAARAAKWKAVSHGLRNLMVAVTLIAVDQAVGTAFFLADGVKEAAQPGNFGPREKSLIIGHGLIAALCIVMWMLGRIGCARVPYLPARRLALPAGIIAGMTGVSGLIGFTLFIFGFAMIQQGNLGGGGLMAGMGQCAIFPAMFGFVVTEILGVWSQIRIAEGLHDVTFGRTSKIMMVVLVLLMTLSICGSCLLAMLVAAAMEKANQKQLQNQQQPPPIVQPADDAAPPGGENKATPPEKKPIEDRQPKKEEPKAKTAPPGEARPAEPKKKPIEDRQPKKEEP